MRWRAPPMNPAIWSISFPAAKGTLAAIVSADLKIVPLPAERGVGLLFFASVAEAMQATAGTARFDAGGD